MRFSSFRACAVPKMKELNLSRCPSLGKLLIQCRNLHTLSLEGSSSVHTLMIWSDSLTELDLSSCESIKNLQLYCPKLNEHNLVMPSTNPSRVSADILHAPVAGLIVENSMRRSGKTSQLLHAITLNCHATPDMRWLSRMTELELPLIYMESMRMAFRFSNSIRCVLVPKVNTKALSWTDRVYPIAACEVLPQLFLNEHWLDMWIVQVSGIKLSSRATMSHVFWSIPPYSSSSSSFFGVGSPLLALVLVRVCPRFPLLLPLFLFLLFVRHLWVSRHRFRHRLFRILEVRKDVGSATGDCTDVLLREGGFLRTR